MSERTSISKKELELLRTRSNLLAEMEADLMKLVKGETDTTAITLPQKGIEITISTTKPAIVW